MPSLDPYLLGSALRVVSPLRFHTLFTGRSQATRGGPGSGPALYSVLFGVIVVVVLGGLYAWVRHRSERLRHEATERERAAMAALLAGDKAAELAAARKAAPAPEAAFDLAAEIRAAHQQAGTMPLIDDQSAANNAQSRDLPPIDYDQAGPLASRELGPVEDAAVGLDPIEDLISQIMVDESGRPAARMRAPTMRMPARPSEAVAALAPVAVAPRASFAATPSPASESMARVPLRELVLAWYESRGYRGVPASPAVWPIELILRHRDDAARAYAFVVQGDYISVDRITALIEQAREIGMHRVAVIAEAGYEKGAKEVAKRRNVRLIDRATMDAELSDLQLETAAKIIAVARTRANAAESSASV